MEFEYFELRIANFEIPNSKFEMLYALCPLLYANWILAPKFYILLFIKPRPSCLWCARTRSVRGPFLLPPSQKEKSVRDEC